MKLNKFSKLAEFLSVAIISSSLLTTGCSRFNNQPEEKTVEDKSKEEDSLIANMDSATVFERCKLYYSSENYNDAFKYCKKSAEEGILEAQFNLGYMYDNGKGVKQDYAKAKEYSGLACDNKDQYGCDMYRKLNQ